MLVETAKKLQRNFHDVVVDEGREEAKDPKSTGNTDVGTSRWLEDAAQFQDGSR